MTGPFHWNTKLVPGPPEAKVAMLHNMLNMCDGEIRIHAGRWTKYECMEEPSWAKEKQPSDPGGNFVEFHTYTEDETSLPGSLRLAVKRHGRGQRGGGKERVMERKKIEKETNDFLEVMQLRKPTTQEEWRAVWKEVGTLLAAKHFISHTPVPVMGLPISDVVDSKENLRFRAMCDERISFPFELRGFPDVYAKLEPYVSADSFVEVKVAWRCNTEQWWWAEVPPSQAGPLYKKLRAFGLDPEGPVGTPYLPCGCLWR